MFAIIKNMDAHQFFSMLVVVEEAVLTDFRSLRTDAPSQECKIK